MLKARAHQKPSTLNPGTSELATRTVNALIIKVKSPKVRIFIGRVSIKIIGLIITLINPKTTAVTSAAVKPETWTPGKI